MKAGFLRRLGAYIIDIILLSLFLSFLFSFFPENKELRELENDFLISTENALTNNELSSDEFILEYENLNYKIAREENFRTLFSIVITFLYFVGLQFYKGQTLGKKVLGIKILGISSSPTVFQLFLRSLIINNLFFDLMLLLSALLFNSKIYADINVAVSGLQFLFAILIINMLLYRKDKRGLHDLIAHTEVVRVERSKK